MAARHSGNRFNSGASVLLRAGPAASAVGTPSGCSIHSLTLAPASARAAAREVRASASGASRTTCVGGKEKGDQLSFDLLVMPLLFPPKKQRSLTFLMWSIASGAQ